VKKPFIMSIIGPTSSGKTAVSINLAKKLKQLGITAEIVSADSRQVYRGLNLLSGKVTKKEMGLIPHHMLDVVSPKKVHSVSDYKKDADKVIDEIIVRGNLPVLVGGTGFYIDAITKGIILPEVPPNKELRKKLEKLETKKLLETLKKLDPTRYREIDRNNRVRLIRAIEIAKALGKVPKIKAKPKYDVETVYVDLPDEELKKKIHTRLLARIKSGMINEGKKLHASGVSWRRMEELGLECRFVALHLQGKMSKKEMIEELEKSTWQYVKRQRTWFKKN
jgi:tRNA dimethylallyltransferase